MVYVYAANVAGLPDPKKVPEVMDGLSENRKKKTLMYKRINDRKQSLGAGLLLKEVMHRHGIALGNIKYGENGKPETDGICFNLSHSHDMVVCTISERTIGCDVEKIEKPVEKIANRFFTENEIAYLEQFEGAERRNEFFRIWTMKESYMKMTGEGFSLPLNRFEFIFEEPVKVCRDGKICSCSIKEYEVPDYKLTVCAEETEFVREVELIRLEEHL